MAIYFFKSLQISLLAAFVCLGLVASATHNRAGEITYRQTGALTFEVTVITYTKASSVPADRDSLQVCWGDGVCQFVGRTNGNGQGVLLGNDIKLNTYVGAHTYPGRGTYVVSMADPNRNGGILNVNPPNSDQVVFYLQTTIVILNQQFQGPNTSPRLLQAPIDIGYVEQPFFYNPNGYDLEGDSIAYELTVPLKGVGVPVDNYSYPNTIGQQPQSLNLDPVTGQLSWISPQQAGEYNIAILVKEYRAGVLISSIIRDMQITIRNLNNRPPSIVKVNNICVVAGNTVNFQVRANDPDANQKVRLTATGGPLLSAAQFFAPATFNAPSGYNTPVVNGTFAWNTRCEHIQEQPYQIVFKAEDNFEDTIGASTFMVVRITVVAPPPLSPFATVAQGQVTVTWESPYACDQAPEFRGFTVWRKESSNPFTPDTCETGLNGRGYAKIASNITTLVNGSFSYTDSNVERGRYYCYRIVGEFAELNPAGFPFNFAESIASDEVCVQMSRDIPLITHASVETTSTTNGSILVRWTRPLTSDLDTLQNAGLYHYRVWRSVGFASNAPVLVATFTRQYFAGTIDTTFTDSGLNTVTNAYTYEVEFLVQNTVSLGKTEPASSVFLTVLSTDKTNIIVWEADVPWQNAAFVICRKNDLTGAFDSIAVASEMPYYDTGLQNGKSYCYVVKTLGSYNIPGLSDQLINFSQEVCGVPIDTVPPCPPVLTATNRCLDAQSPTNPFENFLRWTNPNNTCGADAVGYQLWYAASPSADVELITSPTFADDTTFIHDLQTTVAGCYFVIAFDSVGNQSRASNLVCLDNCPRYELPNVFTPNGDGVNELFVPYPYQFIDRINLTVVNQWGQLVFQTTDPDINWDGRNLQGNPLADGVYYYTCEVFEVRLDGITPAPQLLSGFIHLLGGTR